MIRRKFKLVLLAFMLVAMVAGPLPETARGATPSALLRVSLGIHAALATDCTLFAAAYGSDTQPGTFAQPISFFGAAQTATAGAVVCLLGGRYELPCTIYIRNSGTSSAWITFKSYGDGDVLMVWKGGLTCGDFPMIKLDSTRAGARGTNYVQFIGLTLDGEGTALDGFAYGTDYTQAADGNGIIIDGNSTCSSGAVPPASLVVNNVVYGNGGRCIEANQVSNAWVINNTCYFNNLDPNVAAGTAGSISSQNSSHTYFVNNISVSWQATNPPYELRNASANANFFTNLYWGGPCFFDSTSTPPGTGTGTDFCAFPSSGFLLADPQFANPPHFDGKTPGQYRTARPPSPSAAFSDFAIGANSAAINVVGTDPTTLVPPNSSIWCDLGTWIYSDINGNARGGATGKWDLGAFQH